ncbi:hypothetical protein KR018_002484 [Drosophila ironensis]|nr:hypothetical protein KR018_002484 [Drosophila ironensis]
MLWTISRVPDYNWFFSRVRDLGTLATWILRREVVVGLLAENQKQKSAVRKRRISPASKNYRTHLANVGCAICVSDRNTYTSQFHNRSGGMKLFTAATVALLLLLGQAAGDVAEVQEGESQQEAEESRSRRSLNDIPLGRHVPYDENQAKEQLRHSLNKLTAGEGPHYKIVKVYSATRQVVSGTLTRIDADLIDGSEKQHRCIVEIWAQPWLTKGQDITFKCRNQPVVQARHSRSVEWAEKKTHKKHNHHTLDKVEHLFHKFQVRFGRRYESTAERQMRLRIFRQNLRTIEELNANEMGSAKYGITEFADMTSTEYKERTGLWQRDEAKATGGTPATVPAYSGELPKEFDWRPKNAVTQVKNQGSCGSCWAFSVTGNIEGLYALKFGELKEFSEQELLDCDTTDSACNGGLMDNAYKAIKDIGGLEYEAEYPYEAKKKQCHFNKTMSHVQVSGFVDLPKGNETAMQEWLVSNGPLSIGM